MSSRKSAPIEPWNVRRRKVGVRNRFTAQKVLAAYEKHGMKPHRSAVVPTENNELDAFCTILMGAKSKRGNCYEQLLIPAAYGEGFIVGWSGQRVKEPRGSFQLGYMDGVAAAKAVFGYR